MRHIAHADGAEGRRAVRSDKIIARCLICEGRAAPFVVNDPTKEFRFQDVIISQGRRSDSDNAYRYISQHQGTHDNISLQFECAKYSGISGSEAA